jgi:hypothetical protein
MHHFEARRILSGPGTGLFLLFVCVFASLFLFRLRLFRLVPPVLSQGVAQQPGLLTVRCGSCDQLTSCTAEDQAGVTVREHRAGVNCRVFRLPGLFACVLASPSFTSGVY